MKVGTPFTFAHQIIHPTHNRPIMGRYSPPRHSILPALPWYKETRAGWNYFLEIYYTLFTAYLAVYITFVL